MFKITTKKLAIIAILMALGVVLKTFSIGNGEFRISFWEIPLFLAGTLTGPFYGLICALGTDLIYGLAFSSYPFSFIMMFTTLIWGVAGGIFYNKNTNVLILIIVVLCTSLCGTFINSIYLTLYYGFKQMITMLPLRLCVMLVKWPITTSLIYGISTSLKKMKIDKFLD